MRKSYSTSALSYMVIASPVWLFLWEGMPFISFSCLIALARTSSAMLNISSESGHPCLVPNLRGKTYSGEYDVSCGLVIYGLCYIKYISSE